MAKQTLDALRARMESLRAEWRELPKRRDNALLKGDKDALLDTQIRERQIPYEYLQAIRQRTELFTEQVHAQLNDLAKQREQVRARLVEALPKLEAAWREVDALQQEYLRLAPSETELPLWTASMGRYDLLVNYETRPTATLTTALETARYAQADLDRLLQGVVDGDGDAIDAVRRALEDGDDHLPSRIAEYLHIEQRTV
jgi:chromosome segregation ATPase